MPHLDISPNFPFADDSNAVTPDDICTFKQFYAMRRGSHASLIRRTRDGSSRRSSYGSVRSHRSRGSTRRSNQEKQGKLESLDQKWKLTKGSTHVLPDVVVDKGQSDGESSGHHKKVVCLYHLMKGTPLIILSKLSNGTYTTGASKSDVTFTLKRLRYFLNVYDLFFLNFLCLFLLLS